MPPRLTSEERELRAIEAGFNPDNSILSSEKVLKQLESQTQEDYDVAWRTWERSAVPLIMISF